jgi:short-subunit dehydrogenase
LLIMTSQPKVALITGASSGIGEATARQLARDGFTVILAARRAALLDKLVSELAQANANAYAIPTDMTQPAQIEALAQQALQQCGRVDVLVNNAGVGEQAKAYEASDATIEFILRTNFVSVIQLTRALMPQMLARNCGHVINVASVSGYVTVPGSSIYAASKHALRAWNDGLRRDLRGTHVCASLVSPGFIRTPMTEGIAAPMPGPEAVANAISSLIKRPKREVIVPGIYRLGVWAEAIAPGLMDWALAKIRP